MTTFESIHPLVYRLGFSEGTNAALADAALRAISRQVGSENAVALLKWYVSRFGANAHVSAEDCAAALNYDSTRFAPGVAEAGLSWWIAVDAAGGPERIPDRIAPSRQYAERRIAEIRALCRSDPDGYERNQRGIKDEHAVLLDALEGLGALPEPSSGRPQSNVGMFGFSSPSAGRSSGALPAAVPALPSK